MLYNEFRNIMADTGGIWLWSWLGYLFTSATLALGYTQSAEESEETAEESQEGKRRSSRETREIPEPVDKSEGHGDKHTEATGHELSEKERRILEQDKEMARLHSQLINYIVEQYKSGEVDRMPHTSEILFGIGQGVKSKLLDATHIETIYMCRFKPDSYVPEHNHIQEELIQVLKGQITVKLTDGNGKVLREKQLDKGASFCIKPNIKHIIQSKEGARALMTFEPPIVKVDEDTDD